MTAKVENPPNFESVPTRRSFKGNNEFSFSFGGFLKRFKLTSENDKDQEILTLANLDSGYIRKFIIKKVDESSLFGRRNSQKSLHNESKNNTKNILALKKKKEKKEAKKRRVSTGSIQSACSYKSTKSVISIKSFKSEAGGRRKKHTFGRGRFKIGWGSEESDSSQDSDIDDDFAEDEFIAMTAKDLEEKEDPGFVNPAYVKDGLDDEGVGSLDKEDENEALKDEKDPDKDEINKDRSDGDGSSETGSMSSLDSGSPVGSPKFNLRMSPRPKKREHKRESPPSPISFRSGYQSNRSSVSSARKGILKKSTSSTTINMEMMNPSRPHTPTDDGDEDDDDIPRFDRSKTVTKSFNRVKFILDSGRPDNITGDYDDIKIEKVDKSLIGDRSGKSDSSGLSKSGKKCLVFSAAVLVLTMAVILGAFFGSRKTQNKAAYPAHKFIPFTAEGKFKIIGEKFADFMGNYETPEFQKMAKGLEDSMVKALLQVEPDKKLNTTANIKLIKFEPGINSIFRIKWKEEPNMRLTLKINEIKKNAMRHLKQYGAFGGYKVDTTSFTVQELKPANCTKYECSNTCSVSEETLRWQCTCPETLVLSKDKKRCSKSKVTAAVQIPLVINEVLKGANATFVSLNQESKSKLPVLPKVPDVTLNETKSEVVVPVTVEASTNASKPEVASVLEGGKVNGTKTIDNEKKLEGKSSDHEIENEIGNDVEANNSTDKEKPTDHSDKIKKEEAKLEEKSAKDDKIETLAKPEKEPLANQSNSSLVETVTNSTIGQPIKELVNTQNATTGVVPELQPTIKNVVSIVKNESDSAKVNQTDKDIIHPVENATVVTDTSNIIDEELSEITELPVSLQTSGSEETVDKTTAVISEEKEASGTNVTVEGKTSLNSTGSPTEIDTVIATTESGKSDLAFDNATQQSVTLKDKNIPEDLIPISSNTSEHAVNSSSLAQSDMLTEMSTSTTSSPSTTLNMTIASINATILEDNFTMSSTVASVPLTSPVSASLETNQTTLLKVTTEKPIKEVTELLHSTVATTSLQPDLFLNVDTNINEVPLSEEEDKATMVTEDTTTNHTIPGVLNVTIDDDNSKTEPIKEGGAMTTVVDYILSKSTDEKEETHATAPEVVETTVDVPLNLNDTKYDSVSGNETVILSENIKNEMEKEEVAKKNVVTIKGITLLDISPIHNQTTISSLGPADSEPPLTSSTAPLDVIELNNDTIVQNITLEPKIEQVLNSSTALSKEENVLNSSTDLTTSSTNVSTPLIPENTTSSLVPEKICAEDMFKCGNDGSPLGHCIPKISKCDSVFDCYDKSDETGCVDKKCMDNYQCRWSGDCLARRFVCDGIKHCTDGDDEEGCETWKCTSDEFKCRIGNTSTCLPLSQKCDGHADCFNQTDEQNCSTECPKDQYLCPEGKCIPNLWKCDGRPDCLGGEDEMDCDCEGLDQSPCAVGGCVPTFKLCDGLRNCPDGSDEWGCVKIDNDTKLLQVRSSEGRWSAVCGDKWTAEWTDLVCEQLGLGVSLSTEVRRVTEEVPLPRVKLSPDVPEISRRGRAPLQYFLTNGACSHVPLVHISCREPQCGKWTYDSSPKGSLQQKDSPDLWPSLGLLIQPETYANKSNAYNYACAATVISPVWVLTSYSCLESKKNGSLAEKWALLIGEKTPKAGIGRSQLRYAKQVVVYPGAKRINGLWTGDAVLLRLRTPVTLDDPVQTVCLSDKPADSHDQCVIASWKRHQTEIEGGFEEGRTQSIQNLPVPNLTANTCNISYFDGKLQNGHTCASFLQAKNSKCTGNEGSPLMCKQKDGTWFLQGLLSHKGNCASFNLPSVFTDVSSIQSWILNTIGRPISPNENKAATTSTTQKPTTVSASPEIVSNSTIPLVPMVAPSAVLPVPQGSEDPVDISIMEKSVSDVTVNDS